MIFFSYNIVHYEMKTYRIPYENTCQTGFRNLSIT